ncbi:hypothetical protein SI65_05940 [Aspergillus cristatus]|uniref:Uncharacterized protein n=1 Tax=Aspergillus cristatus TaxID=573508 RepID=A0A1E3BEC8_ASPCR|nr:hypothetical protein SI65_05940 [Aspergillus cristatus]
MNPEYSEEFEQKPLPFKLIEDWDAQEVVQGKKRLEALLNGDVTPHDAAMAFHTTTLEISTPKKRRKESLACAQLHRIQAGILKSLSSGLHDCALLAHRITRVRIGL